MAQRAIRSQLNRSNRSCKLFQTIYTKDSFKNTTLLLQILANRLCNSMILPLSTIQYIHILSWYILVHQKQTSAVGLKYLNATGKQILKQTNKPKVRISATPAPKLKFL